MVLFDAGVVSLLLSVVKASHELPPSTTKKRGRTLQSELFKKKVFSFLGKFSQEKKVFLIDFYLVKKS